MRSESSKTKLFNTPFFSNLATELLALVKYAPRTYTRILLLLYLEPNRPVEPVSSTVATELSRDVSDMSAQYASAGLHASTHALSISTEKKESRNYTGQYRTSMEDVLRELNVERQKARLY